MPELPDLEYITGVLGDRLAGRTITSATVKQPIVIRMVAGGDFRERLAGQRIEGIARRGPFLVLPMDEQILVMHMMLAGRLQYADPGARPLGHLCFSLALDDGHILHYGDSKKMGKIYVDARSPGGDPEHATDIPLYTEQGVDIMGPEFTRQRFHELVKSRRQQVRVFIMDRTNISAVGNAYADEILFDAGLHPKTTCLQLSDAEIERLWISVGSVMRWGIEEVAAAGAPIEKKARDHVKVRNRKGEPCPACGTTIRRANVLGYDAFYCPSCQKPTGRQFVPWGTGT